MCIYNQINKNHKYCRTVMQCHYIIYYLIYSVAISWCIYCSEPLSCGNSRGHRTELGMSWMEPCFSIGLFLCKCRLLVLSCILCVTELWDEWLAWCGGGRWHSFSTGLVTARPAFPGGLNVTPVQRGPFSGFLGVLGFCCLLWTDFWWLAKMTALEKAVHST